jgi:hypothetical protein
LNTEIKELLDLMKGITDVMEEDGHTTITRDQVKDLGIVADGKINNAKESVNFLLEIIDNVGLNSPYTLDELMNLGGLVIKLSEDNKL